MTRTHLASVSLVALASWTSLAAAADPAPPPSKIDQKLHDAVARSGGLTSADVGRRAGATSLDAKAKDLEIDAAEAEVDKAAAGYLPRLSLTARYTRLSPVSATSLGGGGFYSVVTTTPPGQVVDPATALLASSPPISFPVVLDQYLLQANLVVPLSDYFLRIGQAHSSARRARDAARLQAQASRLTAAADAKVAYYAWARAELQLVVAEQALEQARQHEKDVQAMAQVDRASKADLLRAHAAVASAELFVERATNLSSLAEDRVRTVMHDESEAPYSVGEDLFEPVAPMGKQKLATLVQEAVRQRPELRALEHTAWSLRQQKHAVTATGLPRLDAFGDAIYANPNSRFFPQRDEWKATWDVGLQVTWTPNDAFTSSASSRALEAKAAGVDAQRAALADALRTEVLSAYQAAREADVAVASTRQSLDAAEEAFRVRRELFLAERATATELSDAETDLLRARLELVNAQVDARIARVRLEHALGRDARRE